MSRYIDADVAIEEISKDTCGINDYDDGLLTAIFELKTMPTADVVDRNECTKCVLYPFKQLRERLEANMVEVVHGEWAKENIVLTSYPPQYRWHCSNCGKVIQGFDDSVLTRFCPNCGADMRGEDDGEIH